MTTLQLGAVTVTLTTAGSSPIFGPAGTRAAGFRIVSVFPVTVTAT